MLMKSPAERSLPYTIVVVLVAIVVFVCISVITGAVVRAGGGYPGALPR